MVCQDHCFNNPFKYTTFKITSEALLFLEFLVIKLTIITADWRIKPEHFANEMYKFHVQEQVYKDVFVSATYGSRERHWNGCHKNLSPGFIFSGKCLKKRVLIVGIRVLIYLYISHKKLKKVFITKT